MALPATDNFNRSTGFANGTWTVINGGVNAFIIDSDIQARPFNAASISLVYWDDDAFPDDQYSQLVFVSGVYVGVGCRLATGADGYAFGASGALYRYDNASGFSGQTNLTSEAGSLTGGDIIRLECEGTTIRGLINGGETDSVTDATYASGSAGLWGYAGGAYLGDDWEGGSIGGGGGADPNAGRLSLLGAGA